MMGALRQAMAPSGRSFHYNRSSGSSGLCAQQSALLGQGWESVFMTNSGFYTNRIGYTEMVSIFREAGFSVEVLTVERF
jgi:hypothetical protein